MQFSDFRSASFFQNPYPSYAVLRAEGAIVPIGENMVITGRYDIVNSLLHNRSVGKAYLESIRARYGESGPEQSVFRSISQMMLSMNPPDHTPLRALMMKAFNARQVQSTREIIHATANHLIDTLVKDGGADLMSSYALPLPVQIICRMLDVPLEDAVMFTAATHQLMRAFDATPIPSNELSGPNNACMQMSSYFSDLIEARRKKPGDDLVSQLLNVEENGVMLTDDEIIANVTLLFAAGHETTSNMLGNALVALHCHPDQLSALRQNLHRTPSALFECIRYDSSVQSTVRTALQDVHIAGMIVPRNTVIMLILGAANRDPTAFSNPDQLDLGRDDARPLSFGAGVHHCLGYRLALLELETSLNVLLERLPDLQLTNLDDLQWHQRANLRGVKALAAQW